MGCVLTVRDGRCVARLDPDVALVEDVRRGQLVLETTGGYIKARYDLWSAQLAFVVDLFEGFYLDAAAVSMDITLEDGTVSSGLTLGESHTLTFPASADVNHDDVVEVTYTFDIDAEMYHFIVLNPGISYSGKTLGTKVEMFRNTYNTKGQVTGASKWAEQTWGPLSESDYVCGWLGNYTDRWQLPGFRTITAKARVPVMK